MVREQAGGNDIAVDCSKAVNLTRTKCLFHFTTSPLERSGQHLPASVCSRDLHEIAIVTNEDPVGYGKK